MRKIFFQIYHDLIQIYQSAGSIALNLEIATTSMLQSNISYTDNMGWLYKQYIVLPCPVDGDQLLYGLRLDEGAGVFRAVSDNLMDRVQDGDHSVLLQVFGRPLLTAGQVAHQVPHGVTSCKVKSLLRLTRW